MQHPSDPKRRIAAAAAALLAAAFAASGALAAEDSAEKASDSTKQCLMCHGGSFEALREQTKNWTDEFGDKIQPHQYLDSESANPHQGAKVVPECTNCHEKASGAAARGLQAQTGDVLDLLRLPPYGEFPEVQRRGLPRERALSAAAA